MVTRLERQLRIISDSTFVGILLILAVVRVGLSPIGKPWVGWVYDAARAFPKSANYISYSPLPVLIAKVLTEPRILLWWSLFGLLLVVWFCVVMIRIRTLFPDNYRIVQVIFAASQVVMLQATFVGHYDNLRVIGASLVYLYRKEWLIYVGALIAAGANPYMSFATGICVLFLYLGTREKFHLRVGVIWASTSAAMLVLLHMVLSAPDAGTRESIVVGQLGSVIKGAAGVWIFILLGLLGPLWFVYLWFMAQKSWSFGEVTFLRKLYVFIGVVGIPATMSFFILDHTRIGVVVGALPLFLYLLPELNRALAGLGDVLKGSLPVLSVMIFAWLAYPPIIVDTYGVFRLPYAKFITLIFGA